MVLEATLQVNSNVVSGLARLAWQTVPTIAIYKLAETIIAAFNLHQIYDRRTTLSPRNSLLFTLTNVPVGHPPVVLLLSLVLLFHIVLSVVLDFAINGETNRIYRPTTYRTVISAHRDAVPLRIDYAAEFGAVDAPQGQTRFPDGIPADKLLVSRRLVAASEVAACLFLNGTHHTTFAHAYRDAVLDKTLVSAQSLPPLGTCVRHGEFETDEVSVRYALSGFPKAPCEIKAMRVTYPDDDDPIGVGEPTVDADCALRFDEVRCFNLGTVHCGAIARRRSGDGGSDANYIFFMRDANKTDAYTLHELRFARMRDAAARARFGANVAYTQALGLRASDFGAMFVAIADVRYNVSLGTFEREREVTVISLPVLIAVGATEAVLLGMLCLAAGWMRMHWVVRKKRQGYIAFSSLLDVFAMVTARGFVKKHEKGRMTRLVGLVGDEPGVFVDEQHLDRGGGVSKRISESDGLSVPS